MAEFGIQATTHKLLNQLGIPDSRNFVETYGDILAKSVERFVTTGAATTRSKQKIMQQSSTPDDFQRKYEELKGKNVKDLDSLVYLLAKLSEDRKTVDFLGEHCKTQARTQGLSVNSAKILTETLQKTGPTVNQQQLALLTSELLRERQATHIHHQTPAELRRSLRDNLTLSNSVVPQLPGWAYSRPYLSVDYAPTLRLEESPSIPLGSLPLVVQEQCVVDDLLFLLSGVSGKYVRNDEIRTRFEERHFSHDSTMNQSMSALVARVFPTATHYSLVARFIEEKQSFEYGMVNHALCAAMRQLLREYFVLIAQLENQHRRKSLSLQKLWFYLQPCTETLSILAAVASEVIQSEASGGAVLSLLHTRLVRSSGDSKAEELLLYLTRSAAAPYFATLEGWIHGGKIWDPYREFLVRDSRAEDASPQRRDDYWDSKYGIARDNVPNFLEELAENVLAAGKYLNALRLCGAGGVGERLAAGKVGERANTAPQTIVYSLTDKGYVDVIKDAYQFASKSLLEFMLKEMNLVDQLRSLKHYFLVDEGDYLVEFLDAAETELRKPCSDLSVANLSSQMESAVRSSVTNADPYKDNLRVVLLPYDLITQLFRILSIETRIEKSLQLDDPTEINLSGMEALALDYNVTWPLSLIISAKILTRYQMLFRHIFYLKWVERQLCRVWSLAKHCKERQSRKHPWLTEGFALRTRMLIFVQNLQLHSVFDVIEPHWQTFAEGLSAAANIDTVIHNQWLFIDRCLKDCMLTTPHLLKLVSKLMACAVMFTNWMTRFLHSTTVHKRTEVLRGSTLQATLNGSALRELDSRNRLSNKVVSFDLQQATNRDKYRAALKQFESNFDRYLGQLLGELGRYEEQDSGHRLGNVLYRLDYSGFYRNRRGESPRSGGDLIDLASSRTSASE